MIWSFRYYIISPNILLSVLNEHRNKFCNILLPVSLESKDDNGNFVFRSNCAILLTIDSTDIVFVMSKLVVTNIDGPETGYIQVRLTL